MSALFPPCSSDELYAYLTHCRPDLCILEGGEEEGEVDRDEEEFVLIEDKEEVEGEEEEGEEDEEVFQRHRSSGDDWEVSSLSFDANNGINRCVCLWTHFLQGERHYTLTRYEDRNSSMF